MTLPMNLSMVARLSVPRHPCQDFAASMRRPGGLIAAPLDPLLAFLCSVDAGCALIGSSCVTQLSLASHPCGQHAGVTSAPAFFCPFGRFSHE